MKISDKNTALGLLEKIDPFSFTVCEDSEHSSQEYKTKFGLSVVREWPKIVHRFKEKIQYISDPFYQAYNSAAHKLSSVIDAEDIHESGTFISRSSPSETNTIFYDIATEGKGSDFKLTAVIFFFTKDTNREKPSLAMYVQRNSKGIKNYISETGHKYGIDGMQVIADVFTLILFMKYAELQTKIIKSEKKDFHIGIKYVNETKSNIEILDSTWFTTIVRSEGFKVSGHFRMQPFGPKLTERKLIWINPFEKTGYTKTAKILNQSN